MNASSLQAESFKGHEDEDEDDMCKIHWNKNGICVFGQHALHDKPNGLRLVVFKTSRLEILLGCKYII